MLSSLENLPLAQSPLNEQQQQQPWEALLNHVNVSLAQSGFPMIPSSLFLKSQTHLPILNTVYSLLQQKQKDAVFRQDLQERLSILDSENQQLDSQWSKAKAKCDQSYKEISSLKNRADILQTENKALHSQMLLQREELKTFKSNLAFTKSQAAHDVRKKAQELDKMKTRLQKLMNEKSGLKMGMSLVNPLPKASSTVLMDGSKKKETAEEEMYQMVMTNFEAREQELIQENQSLKDFLLTMYGHLNENLREAGVSGEDALILTEQHFQLPFNMAQKTIQGRLEYLLEKLDARCQGTVFEAPNIEAEEEDDEEDEAETEALKNQMESLEAKCQSQMSKLEQQSQLLEFAMKHAAPSMNTSERMDTALAQIEKQKMELEHSRRLLDQERKQFTEAAVRMGIERATLLREKEAIEEEKRIKEMEQVLKQMPSTPFWMKKAVPGIASDSPAASPVSKRIGLDGPLTRSTPKAHQLSMGPASLGSSLSHSDEEFLAESETLQLTTPRNLTTTFTSKPVKSALKKSVRIME